MRTTQAFGEMKEGLYLMQPTSTKSEVSFKNNVVSFQKKNNPILQSSSVSFPVSANVVPTFNLWHVRLGHVPYSVMKTLTFIQSSFNSDHVCDVCPKARQTRLPFPVSQIHSQQVFD